MKIIKTVGDLKESLKEFSDDTKVGIRKGNINVVITYLEKKKAITRGYNMDFSWDYMRRNMPKNGEDVVLINYPGSV